MSWTKLVAITIFVCWGFKATAQIDTTAVEDEEDYSQYESVEYVAGGTKRYCSNKIEGLSPSKLISIGYDYQGLYNYVISGLDTTATTGGVIGSTHGMRLMANIPIISRNSLVIQVGANYWESRYDINEQEDWLVASLRKNGLRTAGVNTTVYKPLNEKQFLLFQGSADLNGNWTLREFLPLRYLKYSAAALWGKRSHDRKQWGVGIARTYRVGEMNYIPVLLYNYTNKSNTWGTEILFPAKAHVRRTFSARKLLFLGYELEGNSYRLYHQELRSRDLEIRRGELRFRVMYETSLINFIWLSAQVGYRVNYSFHVDRLEGGKEFFRGFFGNQAYAMENGLSNTIYFNLSFNLVSP